MLNVNSDANFIPISIYKTFSLEIWSAVCVLYSVVGCEAARLVFTPSKKGIYWVRILLLRRMIRRWRELMNDVVVVLSLRLISGVKMRCWSDLQRQSCRHRLARTGQSLIWPGQHFSHNWRSWPSSRPPDDIHCRLSVIGRYRKELGLWLNYFSEKSRKEKENIKIKHNCL